MKPCKQERPIVHLPEGLVQARLLESHGGLPYLGFHVTANNQNTTPKEKKKKTWQKRKTKKYTIKQSNTNKYVRRQRKTLQKSYTKDNLTTLVFQDY